MSENALRFDTLDEGLQYIAEVSPSADQRWLQGERAAAVTDQFGHNGTVKKIAELLGCSGRFVLYLIDTYRAFPSEDLRYQDCQWGWHKAVVGVADAEQVDLASVADACCMCSAAKVLALHNLAQRMSEDGTPTTILDVVDEYGEEPCAVIDATCKKPRMMEVECPRCHALWEVAIGAEA